MYIHTYTHTYDHTYVSLYVCEERGDMVGLTNIYLMPASNNNVGVIFD